MDTYAVILFKEARNAIHAEYTLKKKGFSVVLVAPPPGLRKGCDLSVKVKASQQLDIIRQLDKDGISYIDLVAFTGGQGAVELSSTKVMGRFIMIRSGNMKLTFAKDSGVIVNVSGGGCSDIPYIAGQLINTSVTGGKSPMEHGSSLCAFLLDRALSEAKNVFASIK